MCGLVLFLEPQSSSCQPRQVFACEPTRRVQASQEENTCAYLAASSHSKQTSSTSLPHPKLSLCLATAPGHNSDHIPITPNSFLPNQPTSGPGLQHNEADKHQLVPNRSLQLLRRPVRFNSSSTVAAAKMVKLVRCAAAECDLLCPWLQRQRAGSQ